MKIFNAIGNALGVVCAVLFILIALRILWGLLM
jgi:hypothetical protein